MRRIAVGPLAWAKKRKNQNAKLVANKQQLQQQKQVQLTTKMLAAKLQSRSTLPRSSTPNTTPKTSRSTEPLAVVAAAAVVTLATKEFTHPRRPSVRSSSAISFPWLTIGYFGIGLLIHELNSLRNLRGLGNSRVCRCGLVQKCSKNVWRKSK